MNSMKMQKDMTLEDEHRRSQSVQNAAGEEWKGITNNSRKNKVSGPKWKWHSVVDVSGDETKVQCSKYNIA